MQSPAEHEYSGRLGPLRAVPALGNAFWAEVRFCRWVGNSQAVTPRAGMY
jgi:hypothetical protein